jgi:hypothetical protein
MSRQAGSIVRGFQSRAGYPSQRAGCRSRLCTAQPAEGQVAATKVALPGSRYDTARKSKGQISYLEIRGLPQRLASEACLRALPWVRCNLHQATVRYRSNHCAAQYSSAGEPASAALPRERYVSGVRRLEPVRIVFPTKQLLVVDPLLWYLCKTFSWMGDQENRFGGHSARKSCRRVNPNDPHFCVGGNDGTEVRHNQTIF